MVSTEYFDSTPGQVTYASINHNAYLSWRYNTEDLVRAKYGIILEKENYFTNILVSVTDGILVQNIPDKAVLINDVFVLKNLSLLDIGVYRCELTYVNETIHSDTRLTVVGMTAF